MFKRQVEAILKSVNMDAEGEWRIAHCLLHIPLTYDVAKEFSAKVADRLYRLKGVEFVPCLELHQVSFEPGDVNVPRQRMEFRALPETAAATAIVPGVEIRRVLALRLKGSTDLTLAISIRFKFKLPQRPNISVFLIDHLKQSAFLKFIEQQEALPLGRPHVPDESEIAKARLAK